MEERIRLDILVSFVAPFFLLFEQKALHFHLALGPTNCAAGPTRAFV